MVRHIAVEEAHFEVFIAQCRTTPELSGRRVLKKHFQHVLDANLMRLMSVLKFADNPEASGGLSAASRGSSSIVVFRGGLRESDTNQIQRFGASRTEPMGEF